MKSGFSKKGAMSGSDLMSIKKLAGQIEYFIFEFMHNLLKEEESSIIGHSLLIIIQCFQLHYFAFHPNVNNQSNSYIKI
jgi:hypothetical protein